MEVYLIDKRQQIRINSRFFLKQELIFGVPQGSLISFFYLEIWLK